MDIRGDAERIALSPCGRRPCVRDAVSRLFSPDAVPAVAEAAIAPHRRHHRLTLEAGRCRERRTDGQRI